MATQRQRVAAALKAFGGDPAIAEKEATKIVVAMLALARGHDIGRDSDGFYSRPRQTTEGPARELRNLATLARRVVAGKADAEKWVVAWAAQSDHTWRVCRPALFLRGTRKTNPRKILGRFSAPGFIIVIPKPAAVLHAIEAELERMKSESGNKKQRKPDIAARNAIVVIRSAYRTITGRNAGRVVRDDGPGPLLRLGLEIDRIFGTAIFPNVDSKRLKKNFGDKGPS